MSVRTALTALPLVVLLSGCAVAPEGADRDVRLVRTEHVLTDLAWATEVDALVGLTEDDRLVEVDPASGETLHAMPLASTGDNLALLTEPYERVFVPQPDLAQVAVVATDSLERQRSLRVGPAPSWVATSGPAHTLLAASESGAVVTGLNVESHEVNVEQPVGEGHEVEVEAAENSRTPTFWVVTPEHATHYGGGYPPRATGRWEGQINTDAFGPDRDRAGRAYLAEEGSSRVLAIDTRPQGLRVVGSRDVGAPVEFLESKAKEEFRVYAVTEDRMTVLGFEHLEVLADVPFRRDLVRAGVPEVNISGLAVGDTHVYLTLQADSRVVRIRKPSE